MEFNATFVITAISFIVFTFVMNWIFYKPVKKIIDERASYIDDNYNEADSINGKAKSILDLKNEKIEKAQKTSKEKIAAGVEESKLNKEKIVVEASNESKTKIEAEKRNLANEKSDVSNELKTQVYDLSKNISEKILGQSIDNLEYNQQIVDEAMDNA